MMEYKLQIDQPIFSILLASCINKTNSEAANTNAVEYCEQILKLAKAMYGHLNEQIYGAAMNVLVRLVSFYLFDFLFFLGADNSRM